MKKFIAFISLIIFSSVFISPHLFAQVQEITLENMTSQPVELFEFSIKTETDQGIPLKTHFVAETIEYMEFLDNSYVIVDEEDGEGFEIKMNIISSDDIWAMIEKSRTEDILMKGILERVFNSEEITSFLDEGVVFRPIRRFYIKSGEEVDEIIFGNEMTLLWEIPNNGDLILTTFGINENDSKITFFYSDDTETTVRIKKEMVW